VLINVPLDAFAHEPTQLSRRNRIQLDRRALKFLGAGVRHFGRASGQIPLFDLLPGYSYTLEVDLRFGA